MRKYLYRKVFQVVNNKEAMTVLEYHYVIPNDLMNPGNEHHAAESIKEQTS